MTITEAAQLVIQAGALTRGADVFVLDMETLSVLLICENDLLGRSDSS